MKFKREIIFNPAWDDRSQGGGIGSVDIQFILAGDIGAVEFLLRAGWWLPHVEHELRCKGADRGTEYSDSPLAPWPKDLGYHSPKPLYKGQLMSADNCPFTGGPCYSSDSPRWNVDPIFEALKREGSEGVWRALEEYYREIFEEVDHQGRESHVEV